MEGVWLISYLVLWIVVVFLAVIVLVHSRLLGLLHHRFGPTGARPLGDGPELGFQIESLRGRTPRDESWKLGFPASGDVLVLFLSPQCQTCNALMPHVRDFARVHPEVTLVLMSTMDDLGMNLAYRAYAGLESLEYILGEEQAETLKIGATPYALNLDSEGVVSNKGIVNNYEHLFGLVRVAEPATEPISPRAGGSSHGSLEPTQ